MLKALSSSLQIEKAMQACIQAAPDDFPADGIFFNYYREDIRSIQFVALATKKYCQLKPSVTSIPSEIVATFKVSDNFSAVILNHLPDDPLTHFVVKTNFRKIKSVILMRLKVDDIRLGAIVFFSYNSNAFTPRHVEIVESLRGVFSLLASRTLYQLKLIYQRQLDIAYSHYSATHNTLPDGVVLSQNSPLHALFNRLPALANADRPIVIQGEAGTGKSRLAHHLCFLINNDERPTVILHAQTLTLSLIQNGRTLTSYKLTERELNDKNIFAWLESDVMFIKNIECFSHATRQRLISQYQFQKEAGKNIKLIVSHSLPTSNKITEQTLFISEPYYSAFSFKLSLPPLRQRRSDIPELVTYYLAKIAPRYRQQLPLLTTRFQHYLWNHDWPGNITELIACLEKALIAGNNGILDIDSQEYETISAETSDLNQTLDDVIRQHIIRTLKQTNGKISGKGGAAEKLAINSNTLYSKMKKLNITKACFTTK